MSRAFIERAQLAASITGGTATAANQVLEIAQLTIIAANTGSIDGKIGASAVPIDAKTNASAASGFIQTFGSAFNGTTWDRVRAGVITVSSTFTGMLNSLPWAIYHLAPATRTNGQGGPVEADPTGNIRGAEQFAPVYEDNVAGKAVVEHRYKYTNITTLTTTVVESAPGLLHAIVINKPVASAVITLYDNTVAAGTIIGTITLPGVLVQQGPYYALYDAQLLVGLTIVTGTAACDLTVSSRP
jgi:hypothetical protein